MDGKAARTSLYERDTRSRDKSPRSAALLKIRKGFEPSAETILDRGRVRMFSFGVSAAR